VKEDLSLVTNHMYEFENIGFVENNISDSMNIKYAVFPISNRNSFVLVYRQKKQFRYPQLTQSTDTQAIFDRIFLLGFCN